jgi:hypothetical protein
MVEHKSASGVILKRGLRPTPRHRLQAAAPHKIVRATPPQVIVVPTFLEMWLNDQYGDCVSAEEAFAKAAYAVMNGQPEIKITDATLMTFCNKYDLLNGANLPPVMDDMISDGFHQDGVTYTNGPYTGVDYSNEDILKNAISVGPVKIGIDANALPSGAGNANGWYSSGGTPGEFNNEDHCVSLCGYGPSAALFAALGVAVPSGFPSSGYLLYTWSTIGVVDYAWIMSTVGEAWVRNPTTAGQGPPPPPPPPPVCPPGQHPDPVTGLCVPDGPTPPPTGYTVTIPDQVIQVPGFFTTHSVTVKGGTYPCIPTSGGVGETTLVIPPQVLVVLQEACAFINTLPTPTNVWAQLAESVLKTVCSLLPPMGTIGAGQSVTIRALPPWLIPALKFLCQFAYLIPAPYGPLIATLCTILPAQAKPCGGC